MRYYLFTLLITLVTLPASAQIFVNKVDVNAKPIQYVEIWEKFSKENGKFFAMLDYGQQDDLKDRAGKSLFVTNKLGQYLEFNSMVEVLNFMFRNGWEVIHMKPTNNIQSYILTKRKDFVFKSTLPDNNKTTTDIEKLKTVETTNKPIEKIASESVTKTAPQVPVIKKEEELVPIVKVERVAKPTTGSNEEKNKK